MEREGRSCEGSRPPPLNFSLFFFFFFFLFLVDYSLGALILNGVMRLYGANFPVVAISERMTQYNTIRQRSRCKAALSNCGLPDAEDRKVLGCDTS